MKEKIVQSFQDLLNSIIEFAPQVVVGLILLIVAIIFAKIVEKVLQVVLTRLNLDRLVQKVGFDKTLHSMGIRQALNRFLPRLVYFLLLMVLARTLADAMGLTAISQAFAAFFAYLPNIVAALLLLVLGSAAAQFAGKTVSSAAEGSGIDFAPTLGRVVTGLIIFLVGVMAISQLNFETEIVRIVTTIILATFGLAFALSVGLGTRDVARNVVTGFYVKRLVTPGTATRIGGHEGIVAGVTATHTLLETEKGLIQLANSKFLDEVSSSWPPEV